MFTGIIRGLGHITSRTEEKDGATLLQIESPLSKTASDGDSIAVNGACLTVLKKDQGSITFRLMQETLQKTNLGTLTEQDQVNLEQPLGVGDTLDGHFVMGHIDGLAEVTEMTSAGDDKIFTFAPSEDLLPYLIPKGSVALDGVSLTIVDIKNKEFTVSIMPFTLEHTTFGETQVGDQVNIEVDMIGKYIVRLAKARD